MFDSGIFSESNGLKNFSKICKHASATALSPPLRVVTKLAYFFASEFAFPGAIEYPIFWKTK